MNIKQSTAAYESWLGMQMPLIEADLKLKHERMAQDPFSFLRATFYRWIQLWPEICSEQCRAPKVLGVGDLHVENFGTWRDAEGRLVWGVNDFDEAGDTPYTNDLVRLAVSALLAAKENHLASEPGSICDSILEGYSDSLDHGGRPVVLAERHAWLRDIAAGELRDPIRFWEKLSKWPEVGRLVPPDVGEALRQAMPEPGLPFRVVHRQAGLGSLGRRRFTALADWRGGMVAREAKELTVSAWHWQDAEPPGELHYQKVTEQAVRVPDPFLKVHQRWLVRRLAPDCSRVELASLLQEKAELRLLRAMGWETANVHLGGRNVAKAVQKDLRQSPGKWLQTAAGAMLKATLADWKEWSSN